MAPAPAVNKSVVTVQRAHETFRKALFRDREPHSARLAGFDRATVPMAFRIVDGKAGGFCPLGPVLAFIYQGRTDSTEPQRACEAQGDIARHRRNTAKAQLPSCARVRCAGFFCPDVSSA